MADKSWVRGPRTDYSSLDRASSGFGKKTVMTPSGPSAKYRGEAKAAFKGRNKSLNARLDAHRAVASARGFEAFGAGPKAQAKVSKALAGLERAKSKGGSVQRRVPAGRKGGGRFA